MEQWIHNTNLIEIYGLIFVLELYINFIEIIPKIKLYLNKYNKYPSHNYQLE